MKGNSGKAKTDPMFAERSADGWVEAGQSYVGILSRDAREALEKFHRYGTDEARAAYADRLIERLGSHLEVTWPVLYELLRLVRDRSLFTEKYPGFQEYFEARLGQPFSRWVELESTYQFAHQYAPDLLGEKYEKAKEEQRKRGAQPGNQNAAKEKTNVDNRNIRFSPRPTGTTVARALRHLKSQQRHDLVECVESGQMSANAAMQAAGLRQRTHTIPHDPQKAAETIRRHFTPAEVAEIARLLHWSNE